MRRYHFDLVESDTITIDEEGLELGNLQAVQVEAGRSLAVFAWDSAKNFDPHAVSIEVRDADGRVLTYRLALEIHRAI